MTRGSLVEEMDELLEPFGLSAEQVCSTGFDDRGCDVFVFGLNGKRLRDYGNASFLKTRYQFPHDFPRRRFLRLANDLVARTKEERY